ncbi:MAG: multidrug transporter AcrB [Proteobacteria bacterium]|nr:MAG: multidrug transporter AcrB [Pseudomonadota bacterium]
MEKFENFIYNLLSSRAKKMLMILATLGIFFASLLLLPFEIVLAKMLPDKSANTFSIYIDTPTGSAISKTKALSDCVINELKKEKNIINMELFLGGGAPLDYAGLVKGSYFKNSKNLAEIVVNLNSKKDRDESTFEMASRIRPNILSKCEPKKTNSVIKLIQQPAGPPTLASLVVELYGENTQGLRELSHEIANILEKTDGLVDVDVMSDDIYKTYKLSVDKEKILRSALSIKQVNEILYLAFEGSVVAAKNSPNFPEQIGLFVRLNEQTKSLDESSVSALKNKLSSLKLMNTKGLMIPLSELVEIKKTNSNPTIMTKNLHQYINVIAETDMVSQVYPLLDARASIKETLKDKYEISSAGLFDYKIKDKKGNIYTLKWDGEMKVSLDTFRDLGIAFITALVLIFFLLVMYYKSFAIGGAILSASFLSLFGVILGHWFIDIFTPNTFFLTATSLIGFIVLMGISSRNSMLLVDFAKLLMYERNVEKRRAIAIATATRAKPIFLTAGTVVLASLMLVTDPIFSGLGASLIFGTSAGILVSLLFVPVLLDNMKKI